MRRELEEIGNFHANARPMAKTDFRVEVEND
jgi:hypothetical protein